MFRIFLAIKCRITCCVPASYSVYTVIAGVNLNNLKANHNVVGHCGYVAATVIAGVNLNNLKANHNVRPERQEGLHTVIAGVNLNNLKANHNGRCSHIPHTTHCYRWRKFK